MACSQKKTKRKERWLENITWSERIRAAVSVFFTGFISLAATAVCVISLMSPGEWAFHHYVGFGACVFFAVAFALITYLTTLSVGWTTLD